MISVEDLKLCHQPVKRALHMGAVLHPSTPQRRFLQKDTQHALETKLQWGFHTNDVVVPHSAKRQNTWDLIH